MGTSHWSRVGIRDEVYRSRISYGSSEDDETMIMDKVVKGASVTSF